MTDELNEKILNAKEYKKIYMSKIDGKFYFRTIRPDGKTNVEAEIITEKLD